MPPTIDPLPAVAPGHRSGRRRSGRRTAHTVWATVVLASLAMTGCATGPRPTLAEGVSIDEPIGEAAVDAVLGQFAQLEGSRFTATYRITNNFGPIVREAVVAHDGADRRSITVGEVRYLLTADSSSTCRLESGTCSEGANDAAISDLQVTHQFYARSAAARLRNDANRRVGPTEAYGAEFAGQQASCVSIPVTGGSKVYCVTDTGVLASYQGPDVLIQLTGFSDQVAEDLFTRAG